MKNKITRRSFINDYSKSILSISIASYFTIPNNVNPLYANDTIYIDKEHNKSELTILNDRPINAETPPHLLDDLITPTKRHFVRNNGTIPNLSKEEIKNWSLSIEGNVQKTKNYSINDLKNKFEVVTKALQYLLSQKCIESSCIPSTHKFL